MYKSAPEESGSVHQVMSSFIWLFVVMIILFPLDLESKIKWIRGSIEALSEDRRREEPRMGQIPWTYQEICNRFKCRSPTQRTGGSTCFYRECTRGWQVSSPILSQNAKKHHRSSLRNRSLEKSASRLVSRTTDFVLGGSNWQCLP